MEKKQKSGEKKKRLWLKALIVVLVLILLAALTVAVGLHYVLDKIGSGLPQETFPIIPPDQEDFETDPPPTTTAPATEPTQAAGEETEPTETQPEETDAPETEPPIEWPEMTDLVDDQVINILLVGQDANIAAGRTRSDTMILLSINKRNNTICLTSFMRDLYVPIPGYSDNRLNAAYAFGGSSLLNDTLRRDFGIVVDGNVAVGFDQFVNIIDVLGGVDVYINAREAEYMRNVVGYTLIEEGMNHLTGSQALHFCRIRKIDSDHYRTERQRRVLTALANAAKSAGTGAVLGLVNEVLPYVSTNLSDSQIVSYATSALSILSSGGSIKSGKVPQQYDYSGEYIHGMQVMLPNLYRCYEYLSEFIYGQ